jgi:putative Holliday junction resolvase
MVIMSVDHGDARTGVAVCDKLEMLAVPLCVVRESYTPKLVKRLAELAREKGAEKIVVGLPRNMDGSLGFKAQACLELCELLRQETGLEVDTFDERLTTVIAHAKLRGAGKKEKQHRDVVDAAAAVEILGDYLTARKNRGEA